MAAARRVVGVSCVLAFAFAWGAVGVARADVKPGSSSGASVVKVGWWWSANDTGAVPPEAGPGADLLPPPPPPQNVPEGALPVSAVAGEPEKVSAIELRLDAPPGSAVTSFLLALRETEESGANANADGEAVKVVACQVTEAFWADGEAEPWRGRPEHDEDQCVTGVRGADGIWTFDLSSLAATWLDENQTNSSSVVLAPDVDSPESFQVVYDGPADDGVGVQAAAKARRGAAGSRDGGSGGTGLGGAAGDLAGSAPNSGEVPAASEVPSATEGTGALPEAAGSARAAPGLYDGIPFVVWLLLPLVLGVAYLVMLALGPRGEDAVTRARHGVSRALERWRSGAAAAKGLLR